MKILRAFLSATSLLLAAAQANAAGIYIAYSEDTNINGYGGTDIDWNSIDLGFSGPHTYSIDGTTGVASDGSGDFDSFYFNVPAGLEVTVIGYQVFALDGGQPYNFSNPDTTDRFGPGMDAVDPGSWGTWEIDIVQVLIDGAGSQLLLGSGDAPLTAGTYEFSPYFWTSGDGYGGWSYGITFKLETATIAPVPVPAAVWLFGSGLLGLVGMARRKKAA